MSVTPEVSSSYILRVSKKASVNFKSLVEQAEADDNVEILQSTPSPSKRMGTISTSDSKENVDDKPSADQQARSPHRPRNSFLVRISNKKKKHKKRRGGKRPGRKNEKNTDFIKKLQKHTADGKVACYKVGKGKHERQLSHKDLRKMLPVTPTGSKLPGEFSSSPGIKTSRTSYLQAKKTLKAGPLSQADEKSQDKVVASTSAEDVNAQIIKVQSEYIEALESEVKRSKVRADLLERSLNMDIKRMQDLIAQKDKAIMHKDLVLQSLQSQNMKLEKEVAHKDNIIDIQGQYISGLEMENSELNRRLSENLISPVNRTDTTNDLQTLYRRVSATKV